MSETPQPSQSIDEIAQDFEQASREFTKTSEATQAMIADIHAKVAAIDAEKASGKYEMTEEDLAEEAREATEAEVRRETLKKDAYDLVRHGINDSVINTFLNDMRESEDFTDQDVAEFEAFITEARQAQEQNAGSDAPTNAEASEETNDAQAEEPAPAGNSVPEEPAASIQDEGAAAGSAKPNTPRRNIVVGRSPRRSRDVDAVNKADNEIRTVGDGVIESPAEADASETNATDIDAQKELVRARVVNHPDMIHLREDLERSLEAHEMRGKDLASFFRDSEGNETAAYENIRHELNEIVHGATDQPLIAEGVVNDFIADLEARIKTEEPVAPDTASTTVERTPEELEASISELDDKLEDSEAYLLVDDLCLENGILDKRIKNDQDIESYFTDEKGDDTPAFKALKEQLWNDITIAADGDQQAANELYARILNSIQQSRESLEATQAERRAKAAASANPEPPASPAPTWAATNPADVQPTPGGASSSEVTANDAVAAAEGTGEPAPEVTEESAPKPAEKLTKQSIFDNFKADMEAYKARNEGDLDNGFKETEEEKGGKKTKSDTEVIKQLRENLFKLASEQVRASYDPDEVLDYNARKARKHEIEDRTSRLYGEMLREAMVMFVRERDGTIDTATSREDIGISSGVRHERPQEEVAAGQAWEALDNARHNFIHDPEIEPELQEALKLAKEEADNLEGLNTAIHESQIDEIYDLVEAKARQYAKEIVNNTPYPTEYETDDGSIQKTEVQILREKVRDMRKLRDMFVEHFEDTVASYHLGAVNELAEHDGRSVKQRIRGQLEANRATTDGMHLDGLDSAIALFRNTSRQMQRFGKRDFNDILESDLGKNFAEILQEEALEDLFPGRKYPTHQDGTEYTQEEKVKKALSDSERRELYAEVVSVMRREWELDPVRKGLAKLANIPRRVARGAKIVAAAPIRGPRVNREQGRRQLAADRQTARDIAHGDDFDDYEEGRNPEINDFSAAIHGAITKKNGEARKDALETVATFYDEAIKTAKRDNINRETFEASDEGKAFGRELTWAYIQNNGIPANEIPSRRQEIADAVKEILDAGWNDGSRRKRSIRKTLRSLTERDGD